MNIVSSLIFLTALMSRSADGHPGFMPDSPENDVTGSVVSAFMGERQVSAAPQDRFYDSNGVRIRYVEQGQGTPVVLIHGYTGNLERHWINPGVFANLANDYRVIAIDCRGHGKSGKPANPRAYALPRCR